MTIKINKEYTLASQLDTIKEKAHEFKTHFTEGDLLRMYVEATDAEVGGEILKCEVKAFASNALYDDASFLVQLIVDDLSSFHRIRFYISEEDGAYAVNTDQALITHDLYGYTRTV